MQHPMLNIATQAARSASRTLLKFLDQPEKIEISEKDHNYIVTNVDQIAEAQIIEHLKNAYPEHGILAEEHGLIEGNEYTWVIDPIDGISNFVHNIPHFAISICLKKDGEVELGLIYDPIRNELFTAVKGGGAFLDNRRIRVSTTKNFKQALLGTGFPYRDPHHIKPYMNTFTNIFPLCSGLRRAGSAALDLAYVAAGRLDGFWEASLKEWDIAAGMLLIKEAGGIICDFSGEDKSLDSGSIITGNPKIFKTLSKHVLESLHELQ